MRAIRSYIGANSGLLTQREHLFYDQREDVRTFVRVHSIPGLLDFFDYSEAAAGMRYSNNNNGSAVAVDGNPDAQTAGALTWERVDGAQGGLSIAHSIVTDVPGFTGTSYYLDDSTPTQDQCTGDAAAYGSSGPWINHDLPNTDPRSTPFNTLRLTRTIYYEQPGKADRAARAAQVASQFQLSASSGP